MAAIMKIPGFRFWLVIILLNLLSACTTPGGSAPPEGSAQATPLTDDPQAETTPHPCDPQPGTPFYFRKVVAIAGITQEPDLARDLPGLAELSTSRLRHHMDRLDRFVLASANNVRFDPYDSQTAATVRQLGERHSAQFVATARFHDLSLHYPWGRIPLTERTIFTPKIHRDLIASLYLFDAQTGTLLQNMDYQELVEGKVIGFPGNSINVQTSWFSTPYGSAVDALLGTMSHQLEEWLACIPFATRVRVVDGMDIHIEAGHLRGLRPGDELRLYNISQITGPRGPVVSETPGQWIKIQAVYPERSIARIKAEGEYPHARLGDYVRAW